MRYLSMLSIIHIQVALFIPENNACELYFEERNMEAFTEKLEKLYPETKYVTRLMTYSWEQKVIRFYDLDGNLIEVRTPMRG